MIFRREPLHKKLAREAQLEQTEPAAFVDPGPHWGNTGIHGVPRPRRWDAVASAEASGLSGDELHFIALPNGDLVVEEDEPPDTLGTARRCGRADDPAPVPCRGRPPG